MKCHGDDITEAEYLGANEVVVASSDSCGILEGARGCSDDDAPGPAGWSGTDVSGEDEITVSAAEYQELLDLMWELESGISKIREMCEPERRFGGGAAGYALPLPGDPPLGSVMAGIRKSCEWIDRLYFKPKR